MVNSVPDLALKPRNLGIRDDNMALGVAPSDEDGGAAEVKWAAMEVAVLEGRGREARDAGHVAEGEEAARARGRGRRRSARDWNRRRKKVFVCRQNPI
jgi:hypothetical protein